MSRSKTACVAFAIGCPRNQMDTAWLSSYFRANGWRMTHNARNADLIVVATCGFAAHIEEESIRLVSFLDKKRRKDSQLVVVGCLAGINAARVHQEFDATVVRPADINQLDTIIGARIALKDIAPVNCVEPHILAATSSWSVDEMYPTIGAVAALKLQAKRLAYSLLSRVGTERFAMRTLRRFRLRSRDKSADPVFFIRIARGCLEECTYCAIRYAAGTLRSKPLDDILAEFDRGLAQKYTAFEILAEDIGSYGLDIGSNCVELFEQLFRRPGPYKLVLTDVNVRYLIRYTPALSDIFAAHTDRIQLLKVPVQSGSDRILQLMKRCYTRTEARTCLTYLREKAPTLPLDTHVLIGFPGETDEDFEDTMDLLRSVRFDQIQVFSYTDRPNTVACDLTDKVPERVKRQRIMRLLGEFPQAQGLLASEEGENSGLLSVRRPAACTSAS
jgi:tRNA A37 methylthiotransferase MiaB